MHSLIHTLKLNCVSECMHTHHHQCYCDTLFHPDAIHTRAGVLTQCSLISIIGNRTSEYGPKGWCTLRTRSIYMYRYKRLCHNLHTLLLSVYSTHMCTVDAKSLRTADVSASHLTVVVQHLEHQLEMRSVTFVMHCV
jgi:hypothetical protein